MNAVATLAAVDSRAWAEALSLVPHDIYHLPEYVAFDAAAVGGRPVAFVYREHSDTLLVPLVLRGIDGTDWLDATSPYGYPGPVSNVQDPASPFWARSVKGFHSALAAEQVVACFLRSNPLFEAPAKFLEDLGTVVSHGLTVAVDLTKPADVRWSETRSMHRRQINRARREGFTTVIDDWSLLPGMAAAYHETMTRVEADPLYFYDLAYFERLRETLADNAHLLVATREGEVAAGVIALECGGIVQYHLGGTFTTALNRQPMKLVLADAIEWAAGRGNHVLHLGGGVGGAEDPLFHFKAGFSHWHRPFATVRTVVDHVTYRDLVAARTPQADPEDTSAFFPAYRAADRR